MQIAIDIPDHVYKTVIETGKFFPYRFNAVKAIKNGTIVPKRHGRLTDLDELINFTYNTYGINSGKCITKDNEDIIDYIYNKAETIIEADEEVEI